MGMAPLQLLFDDVAVSSNHAHPNTLHSHVNHPVPESQYDAGPQQTFR